MYNSGILQPLEETTTFDLSIDQSFLSKIWNDDTLFSLLFGIQI